MSVIDWLSPRTLPGVTGPALIEPQVAPGVFAPEVEVTPLPPSQEALGLVPPEVTGLSADLWQGSDAKVLAKLISKAPVIDSPTMQRLLFSLLISDSYPPLGDSHDILLLARLDRLLDLGAPDPALALVEIAGPTASDQRFSRWFDAALMLDSEDAPCAALSDEPHLSKDMLATVYCAARRGDFSRAFLITDAAGALGEISLDDTELLLRFLSPEFDDSPPLPPLDGVPSPVQFRLYEAIGEPIPTTTLPRLFANADLRDVAGWKAQLYAAERLARSGALNPNQLLGLYSAHDPAASGGVWDRVAANQRLDEALAQGNTDGIKASLPEAWSDMAQVFLEVPLAAMHARFLTGIEWDDPELAALAWRMQLLDSGYRAAAVTAPDEDIETLFLQAMALDHAPMHMPRDAQAVAISAGLMPSPAPSPEIADLLRNGQTGEALLRLIAQFDSGARGNLQDLSAALAGFRAAGLGDVANRAALELRLLDRRG